MSTRRSVRALLALLCVAGAPHGDGGHGEDWNGALRGVLCRAHPGEVRGADTLASGLAALGPEAIPTLYGLVTGAGLDALTGDTFVQADWFCLPEEIPALCARALTAVPAGALIEHLRHVLEGQPTFPERLGALRLLGGLGSADGLALLLRDARELGALELGRPSVHHVALEALVAVLRRDARAVSALAKSLDSLEPEVGALVVEALGACERVRAMDLLEHVFAHGPVASEDVVEAMAALETARPWELAGRTLATCRPWWRSQEPARRACVARLAARVHAVAAVPELFELVAQPDALVRRQALQSLEELAAAPLGADSAAWPAWYERELAWRETRFDVLLEQLALARPGAGNAALRELMEHALFRDEVAHAVAARLCDAPRPVALAACTELARLRSRWALPGLVAALGAGTPPVRSAAWNALRAITGEEHELDLHRWRALIDS